MSDEFSPPESAFSAWQEFIDDAVGVIVEHENHDQFVSWIRDVALTQHRAAFPPGVPSEMISAVAVGISRAIWNATPLPSHGYKPKPLPKPERNRPCPCGSGRKYKRCCAGIPEMVQIDSEEIWPIVIDRLTPDRLEEAIHGRHIPHIALADLAMADIQNGYPRRAVKLLEPIFAGDLKRLDERSTMAFSVLCDAYDELGWKKKKNDFIDRVAQAGSRELQSEAWQRKAVVLMDKGKSKAAWDAHRQAQQLTPRHPSIGLLEVNLLMGEDRTDEARDAGRIWLKRLERDGIDPDDPMMEFFSRVATNPITTFSDISMEQAGAGASELRALLTTIEARPLPAYSIGEPEPMDTSTPDTIRKDIAERLALMDVRRNDVDDAVNDVMESFVPETDNDDDQPHLFSDLETDSDDDLQHEDNVAPMFVLRPPEKSREVEAAWQAVCPVEKPFSVTNLPQTTDDPWDPELFIVWFEFLTSNPEAFDSLTVLDDLVIAIEFLDADIWTDDTLSMPILNRAAAIVNKAVADGPDTVQLPWVISNNRPALRLLVSRATRLDLSGDIEESLDAFRLILKLNPHDNHGVRGVYVNKLLKQGDYEDAFAVIGDYPQDMLLDIDLGKIFALYKLGREAEAIDAIRELPEYRTIAIDFLVRTRVKRPKMKEYGIQLGGKDEAWIYREEIREAWAAVPGLLNWLKRHAKEIGTKAPNYEDFG